MGTATLFSLDYELFFGARTGSVERCLIEPTSLIAATLERHGAKLSLFVDSGFMVRLGELRSTNRALDADFGAIARQLGALAERGHDLQLHIHPHWVDCRHAGGHWRMDLGRFKLHQFDEATRREIVAGYKSQLEQFTPRPVFAYRAGGWCIQPFESIADALATSGVWLDSTLFESGRSEDPQRGFDFADMPLLPTWRFSTDPLVVDDNGYFLEVPISSYPLGPLFYWEMALRKTLAASHFAPYGDGSVKTAAGAYYLRRLMQTVPSPVSLDGLKARVLEAAYQRVAGSGLIFNVMGHPKSLTPYSLNRLDEFLREHPELEFQTFQDFHKFAPAAHE